MGLKDWLARSRNRPSEQLKLDPEVGEVQLSGTTTVGTAAVADLVRRHGLPDRGMLDGVAVLQREPDNPVDASAVAAWVEGGRVGYLPSYLAQRFELRLGAQLSVPMRLFSVRQADKVRGKAWVWLGSGVPRWQYDAANPPPLTLQEQRAAEAAWRTNLVQDALAGGGQRAEEFRAGMVGGVHYLGLSEPIKQLKREGRLREALVLCYQAIEGAERAADGRGPAPSYTEHAAIIHRKLGERDQEVAVLQRWLDHTMPEHREGSKIAMRLEKLQR